MNVKTIKKIEDTSVTKVESDRSAHTFAPDIDVFETTEEFCLLAEMPGVEESSVDVMFERGELVISGKKRPTDQSHRRYLLREYAVGDYHRVLRIGEVIDHSNIAAEYLNGLLKVHLPKSEAERPRRIEVKTG